MTEHPVPLWSFRPSLLVKTVPIQSLGHPCEPQEPVPQAWAATDPSHASGNVTERTSQAPPSATASFTLVATTTLTQLGQKMRGFLQGIDSQKDLKYFREPGTEFRKETVLGTQGAPEAQITSLLGSLFLCSVWTPSSSTRSPSPSPWLPYGHSHSTWGCLWVGASAGPVICGRRRQGRMVQDSSSQKGL